LVHHHGAHKCDGHFADFRALLEEQAKILARQISSIKGRAEMRLRFIQAADAVAQEDDELTLGAAAESLRDVGHDRFRGIIDLLHQAVVAAERLGLSFRKDRFGPSPGSLPDQQVREPLHARHDASSQY
jgi:hypothetical protein